MRTLALVLLCSFVSLFAQAFEVPPLESGVNDNAHILHGGVSTALSEALAEIHKKGGPQLAVLTVPSIDPLTIEDASFQVAKSWKLGTERGDNGILVFVAPSERKVRIEVGQALEGDLPDAYCRRIIDNIMIPQFRAGSYTNGVVLGVDAILRRMNPPINLQDYMKEDLDARPHRDRGDVSWFRLLIYLAIFIILLSSRGGGSGMLWFLLGSSMGGRGSGRGWGGGSGGGGGWSGGGGGFSGGGSIGFMVIPKWLDSYLSESDLQRLEVCVQNVEKRTEAEIVPVIVRSSSHYLQAQVTLILTGLLVLSVTWEALGINMHWDAFWPALTGAIASLLVIFLALPRLARFPLVQRLFTVRSEELEQCWRRAQLEFYENRVNQTKDAVGVLIFISLLERSVFVLADKHISETLPKDTWKKVVDEIVTGMKSKKMADGMEKGLATCSDLLAQHFPVKSGDVDELPNNVIIKE